MESRNLCIERFERNRARDIFDSRRQRDVPERDNLKKSVNGDGKNRNLQKTRIKPHSVAE